MPRRLPRTSSIPRLAASIPGLQPTRRLASRSLGFSKVHSSLAPPVLNLATGKVTVCFHAIFDNDFTTVSTVLGAARPLADAWADIFQLDGDREVFLVPEEMADASGCMVPLDPVWCPQDVTGGSFDDDDLDAPVASRTRSGQAGASSGAPHNASEGVPSGASEGASEGAVSIRTRGCLSIVAHAKPPAAARLLVRSLLRCNGVRESQARRRDGLLGLRRTNARASLRPSSSFCGSRLWAGDLSCPHPIHQFREGV